MPYINPMNEDIETFLMHPVVYFKNMVTLYHGSTGKFDKIVPNSLNIGTRLSNTRRSSFWSDDKYVAIAFSLNHYLYLNGTNKKKLSSGETIGNMCSAVGEVACLIYNKNGNMKLLINDKQNELKYRKFLGIIKDDLYLYTKRYSPKIIGSGQAAEIREFTIDTDVIPDTVEKVTSSDINGAIVFELPRGYTELSSRSTNVFRKLVGYSDWGARRQKIFGSMRYVYEYLCDNGFDNAIDVSTITIAGDNNVPVDLIYCDGNAANELKSSRSLVDLAAQNINKVLDDNPKYRKAMNNGTITFISALITMPTKDTCIIRVGIIDDILGGILGEFNYGRK